jgi:hypothetical protein
MFYYDITGYGAHKKLCEDILIWFATKFYPRHKLDITVCHRGMKREGAYGYCDIEGEQRNPRTFLIELQSNMNKRLYALTLMHELIHQYSNELTLHVATKRSGIYGEIKISGVIDKQILDNIKEFMTIPEICEKLSAIVDK